MVLKAKNTDAATPATATKFEGMDESGTATAVIDKPAEIKAVELAVQSETPAAETASTVAAPASEAEAQKATAEAAKTPVTESKPAAAAAAASAETAVVIAEAKAGALAVSKKFIGALSDKENVFPPGTLDFNTFPRVTVGLDGFSQDDGKDLGKEIKIEVMSYNTRWVASPGDDSDEAKKHVRYSTDGKFIASNGDDNGQEVQAYIQELKVSHGYEDAGLKEYLSIYGFLTSANGESIPDEDRQIVELQVPPQSRVLFQRHQITEGVKIQRGIIKASDIVVCRQEKKNGTGTKKFALIHFASK
jgi:hypothetical protein